MARQTEAAKIARTYRKHLDAFLAEIEGCDPVAWQLFAISASRRIYDASTDIRKLKEAKRGPTSRTNGPTG